MKTKITISIFLICLGFNFVHSQFTTTKPDLRLCGTAPNYYQDFYNCTSNNYTLNDVFLSLTDVNGVPLNNTTCTPGVSQTMYVMLNYTSNSNSNIYHARMFADLIIDGVTTQINVNLGTVAPGSGQRLLYGPFTWVCGQEMILDRILIVWKTSGNGTELIPYSCNTYNKSQCEFPTSTIIKAPLAVQFEYSGCTNGSISTINFDSTTNGGTPPYSYAWDFDSNGTTDSTQENPTFNYNNSSSNTASLTVTDAMGLTNTYSVPIVYPSEVIIKADVQGLTCVPGSTASIDLTISGGTAPYTVLWNTGATSQDLSNLGIGNYSATITDALGCIKYYSTTISAVVCCEFLVTCPTFSPVSLQCYDLLPQATSLTELEFEALGNGNGIIGNNPCGVIQITASNSAYLGCNTQVTRTYTITEYLDANDNGIRDAGENTILNVVTCFQIFTINDTTDPTITTQASNLEVQCDGAGNTAALNAWLASNGGAAATDVCSSVTWTNNFTSVSDTCGATGSASVTFTATDNCGNSSSTTATFTIIDNTNPTITTQASNLEVQCDGSGNTTALNAWLASNGGAAATDVCSSVTWSNNFTSVSDTCGATGSASVTFTATDNCGNSSSTTATFTIIDNTNPTITTQASNLEVQCDGNGNTAALNAWLASNGGASATDVCSSVTWSNNFTSVSDTCGATGSASVTFTATDNCGNSSSTTATFTIIDNTNPVISVQASNLEVQCDGNGNTAALNAWLASNGGASASDVCSSVTWSNNFTSVSDTCGATGSASVTFTATDNCGNSSSTTATFTIIDNTNPVISVQASNLEVQCDGNGNTAALNAWLASNGGASASDVCSSVTWSNNFTSVSDTCGSTGSASVTFTATDNCGNSSSTTATFTIIDNTNPTITTQASNLEVQCDGNGNTADLNTWLASNGGAAATDVCSNVTWTNNFTSVSDTCGATGSATVTFTATDNCGNSSSTTATFTIIDNTNPVFTSELPQNISVSCDAIPNPAEMTGSDNCSDVTITVLDTIDREESQCEGEYIISRTWTITDNCNNSSSYTQTITVFDTTPPTLTTQLNSQISVSCSEIPEIPELVFTDNCSGVQEVVYNETSTIISIYEYVIVREWVVSDNCGNEANFSQTINVSVEEPFDAIPFAICIEDDPIDLFTILDDSIPTTGEWLEVTNSGGLTGSIFNPINVTLGYYTFQYVVELEDNSCPMIYEVYLNVNDDCVVLAACEITVYNAVSPNDDTSNDFFFIDGLECYPDNTVEIYNRWGILVYDETGYDNTLKSFKGISEGRNTLNKNELLPDGTYFYILKYTDEENKNHEKTGYLYLNR